MRLASDTEPALPTATDGHIAVVNLESARQAAWHRFWRDPQRTEVAELIVEQEQATAQFSGHLEAFDRLETLSRALAAAEPLQPAQPLLVKAQIDCSVHRFADARAALASARAEGAAVDSADRLALVIDQATGTDPHAVLAARRARVQRSGSWGECIPLAALLVDLGEYGEAEHVYLQGLLSYPDVSPFALASLCFQLGMLWGERVDTPRPTLAVQWYRSAIDYVPCYVKARVHLAEICLADGRSADARELLLPALASGDPEVSWRLGDAARAAGDEAEAAAHLRIARTGFEALLARHLLAFADHGAEFYAGSGDDAARAYELARINLANRRTLRAFEQAHATALDAGQAQAASRLREDAARRWGNVRAFQHSSLADGPNQLTEEEHAGT